MHTRVHCLAALAALAALCVLCSADNAHACLTTTQVYGNRTSTTGAEVTVFSMLHSGQSTVDFRKIIVPGGVDSLFGQLHLCSLPDSGLNHYFQRLLALYTQGLKRHPKQVMTVDEKALGQSQFKRLGATPRLMFGLNLPIRQGRMRVELTDTASAAIRAAGLVEPLYFHIEIQTRYMGSLADLLAGVVPRTYALNAVDYVLLVVGYVRDFRVWIEDDVIPFDARPGNMFYSLAVEDDHVSFHWGEFSPARNPSDVDALWASAIACYNGIFTRLRAHFERADAAFPHRELVIDLIDVVRDASPTWQVYSHRGRERACVELHAVWDALMARIAKAPDAVLQPFLLRMLMLAIEQRV